MYKILESRIEFVNNAIQKITVLVDCTSSLSTPLSDVRAIYATADVRNGYLVIPPCPELSERLLQDVAALGCEDHNRDKTFPGWKSRFNSRKMRK